MPSYILRYAGTNIIAGFYSAPNRRQLAVLLDERHEPSNFECAVMPAGFGIEFYKDGGPLNVLIGDLEGGELLGDEDAVYVSQDVFDCLWGKRELRWTSIL